MYSLINLSRKLKKQWKVVKQILSLIYWKAGFIFTPDVNEISATYEYTGEDVGYYVESYNMPDHPKYGDIWLEPLQQGYDYISMFGLYTAPDGSTTDITANRVTNKIGRYAFNVYIGNDSESWYGRNMCLYITIV